MSYCTICLREANHRASSCPRRPGHARWLALGLALLLPGCAMFGQPSEMPVAVDTFCLSAKKRIWSINDTPDSIRSAQVWNTTIDKRCGVPGKAS